VVAVIRNARVLQEDFLPKEVVHRHRQMNRIAAALEPVVEGDRPQHAFLTGPSGAGKTCIARYSLDRLSEQLLAVDTHYVDCWQHANRFRALYKVLEGVGTTYDVHRSTPHDEMLGRLEALEEPYVVVLDEVDQLEDKHLLRELYAVPAITMVLVANREADVVATLDERLQSRLRSSEHVRFPAYTDDELVTILADRVGWGLEPDCVTDDQLRTIATAAAGNARDAIGILRSAARRAEREGRERVTDDLLSAAIPEGRAAVRRKDVDRLNPHQRALYDLLADAGEIAPGALYDRYEESVDDPRTQRTCRTYLSKLERYNLVRAEGRGRSRVYVAVEPA
jgi:orc1/cdc6 family replication initiation protein